MIPMRIGFIPTEPISCVFQEKEGRGALFIGNINAAYSIALLARYKIKAVLTVAQGTGLSYPKSQKIAHLVIPADDIPSYNLLRHFQKCIKFIQQNIKNSNLLVHCFAGISRSATIVLAYLIRTFQIPLILAVDNLRKRRGVICPNIGFYRQLQQFDKQKFLTRKQKIRRQKSHEVKQQQVMNFKQPIFKQLPDQKEHVFQNKQIQLLKNRIPKKVIQFRPERSQLKFTIRKLQLQNKPIPKK